MQALSHSVILVLDLLSPSLSVGGVSRPMINAQPIQFFSLSWSQCLAKSRRDGAYTHAGIESFYTCASLAPTRGVPQSLGSLGLTVSPKMNQRTAHKGPLSCSVSLKDRAHSQSQSCASLGVPWAMVPVNNNLFHYYCLSQNSVEPCSV